MDAVQKKTYRGKKSLVRRETTYLERRRKCTFINLISSQRNGDRKGMRGLSDIRRRKSKRGIGPQSLGGDGSNSRRNSGKKKTLWSGVQGKNLITKTILRGVNGMREK